MARIPTASRESVPQDQLAVFDELVSQRGSVPDIGPIAIMINVPELTKRGEHLRAYIRGDETGLPASVRELAMIVTAREMDCQFIWNAHAAFGRQAGLSDELVNSLRDKEELPSLAAEESAVVNYGREFFRTHKVSQSSFDTALSQFGVRGLVELTNLMGYYSSLAFNINAFDVGLPAGITESPLPV
jgi:4-carboxymuconolactone decarboxylase